MCGCWSMFVFFVVFFSHEGSWAHPARMSVTFRGTAAWIITYKYWRKHYGSDTWPPQRLIRSVSQWCPNRITRKHFAWGWFEFFTRFPGFCVRLLPILPKRPFHLGGVSPRLLQWQCLYLWVQARQRSVCEVSYRYLGPLHNTLAL